MDCLDHAALTNALVVDLRVSLRTGTFVASRSVEAFVFTANQNS